MRRIILLIFLIASNQAIGQFHFRLHAGRSFGDITTSRENTYSYNGASQPQPMINAFYIYQGNFQEHCTYSNTGRIGIGIKYNKNRFFLEFSPTFDYSSFTYNYRSSGNYTYFYDEAHLNPVNMGQILAYNWPQNSQYSITSKKHDVFAIGLNFNLGFQISDRHSVKLFVCDTRMPLNQFGTDVDWDDSDKRYVSSGDYSYFETFTNRSIGISYELDFSKKFYFNVQASLPIKAFDQKGEEFYMPVKKSPFVNLNIGFQFPNKSEKIQKVKKDKMKSNPQIL